MEAKRVQGGNGMGSTGVDKALSHISEKPWSDYSESDYTLEQWHAACLIHQHDGPPTSKAQCKLPVKTPNGALNRNGVHAAAAALAGARGGVNASSEEKASAARALVRYYGQLDETPPSSISNLAHGEFIEGVLEHFGVKGMHWGQRKGSVRAKSGLTDRSRTRFEKPPHRLTNDELKKRIARMEMEKRYNELNRRDISQGEAVATQVLKSIGVNAVTTLGTAAAIYIGKQLLKKKLGNTRFEGMFPPKKKK